MLIVTGVFIGFVLVVMVGQTVRTMQGTGWVPITPIDITLPYWTGLWFGVFPTVETIGAQIAAAVFVIGSYFLAQEMKVKRPRRRRAQGAGRRADARARARARQPATRESARRDREGEGGQRDRDDQRGLVTVEQVPRVRLVGGGDVDRGHDREPDRGAELQRYVLEAARQALLVLVDPVRRHNHQRPECERERHPTRISVGSISM